MRRADRLFQIVQLLRRDRLSTGAKLARELGISPRTLYRDISDLMASGVPIESEAGVGYRLPRHFELPPLMFTADEIEALVAGARMVEAWADPGLQEAARSLLRKAEAVLPSRRKLEDLPILVPDFHVPPAVAAFLGELRVALRERRKIRVRYLRGDGEASERVLRPVALAFWGRGWSLGAWCELRKGFRTFRPDRIQELVLLDETFEPEAGQGLDDYLRMQNEPR
ncbi:MAG TPA: YafY family protein [Holophagaceae bacterium]|jgi:predicted DNA-binding transcriptional regulator YafY|nr:YafY family protein [Holophagaceae bacterium]